MKKYIYITLFLFVIYLFLCLLYTEQNQNSNYDVKKNSDLVLYESGGKQYEIPIEEYIFGVLACEVPALFEKEALKAVAVAINTYYLYKVLNEDKYIASNVDQCYCNQESLLDKWQDKYYDYEKKLMNVISEVKDEYIFYNEEVIEAFYFSTSNGFTENSYDVFNVEREYLISKESSWDINVNNFISNTEISENELKEIFDLQGEISLNIKIMEYTISGRVKFIKINDKIYSGVDFRRMLNLRSTDFEIWKENDTFYIRTKGYGHGVGLSQYGANEMAKIGYSYKEILNYYYNETEVKKMYK